MSLSFHLMAFANTGARQPVEFSVFQRDVTHNLQPMWEAAGIYDVLYRSQGVPAEVMLPRLRAARELMMSQSDRFLRLNPPNGWGNYGGAIDFLNALIEACEMHPLATTRSRA